MSRICTSCAYLLSGVLVAILLTSPAYASLAEGTCGLTISPELPATHHWAYAGGEVSGNPVGLATAEDSKPDMAGASINLADPWLDGEAHAAGTSPTSILPPHNPAAAFANAEVFERIFPDPCNNPPTWYVIRDVGHAEAHASGLGGFITLTEAAQITFQIDYSYHFELLQQAVGTAIYSLALWNVGDATASHPLETLLLDPKEGWLLTNATGDIGNPNYVLSREVQIEASIFGAYKKVYTGDGTTVWDLLLAPGEYSYEVSVWVDPGNGAVTVPEPSTMLLIGLSVMFFRRRHG